MGGWDAIVVGSGYGGSIPAARLAEAGMTVLVLERGPRLTAADYRQSDDPRDLQRIVDLVVASDNIAYRTGKLVGGASVPMDGAHFRVPRASFEARDAAGRRYWPDAYDRDTLDPYYDRVEAMLSIRQLAWSEISRAGGHFARMLDAAGATCDRARLNYTDCLHCGFCSQGCIFEKKRTMLQTYLPLAEASGAVVMPGCFVETVAASGTGYSVRYLREGVAQEATASHVVIGCGGIHSAALLLRSAAAGGLERLSAQVGENFNNNGEHPYVGILPPELDDLDRYHCYRGMENAGMMTYHWFDSDGFTLHPGGGIEPSIFAASLAAADHPVLPRRSWGMEYKRFVESVYPHRVIAFSSLGLADGHRAVTLKADGSADLVDRDRASYDRYLDRIDRVLAEVSSRTGITLLAAVPRRLAGMTATHLLSACRMAERVEDGVVDPDGQVFGHENLWLCDASALPYALGVNPALTISAVAERTSERILARG